MRKSFFNCIKTSLSVVGSVIGAGFITGKEIYEFFSFDLSVCGVYLAFVCFFIFNFLLMKSSSENAFDKCVKILVALSNVVITGCMIAGLNAVYKRLFGFTEKVKIFSIITAILIFFMTINGIDYLEKINFIIIPILLIVVVCFSCYKIEDLSIKLSPSLSEGRFNPIIYVGFNLFLSSTVIKNSGEKLSPPFKLLSSFIISLLLSGCILLISVAIKDVSKNHEMPFYCLFANDIKLSIIIDIITLFAIYSTLLSSIYTSVNFGGLKLAFRYKVLVFLFSVSLSFAGFSVIVEKLYPIIGFVGITVFCFIFLSQEIFQARQLKRTLCPLKRTV